MRSQARVVGSVALASIPLLIAGSRAWLRPWQGSGGSAPGRLLRSILLVCLLLSCHAFAGAPQARITGALLGGRELSLEVVSTPDQMRTGLMFRDRLDENAGMLFVYPRPQPLSFWMKNTRLPLSIAFIREDGTIANLRDMTPFDEKTFHQSEGDCLYALEVNRGWFARHGITAGQKLRFLKTVDDSAPAAGPAR